MTQAWNTFITQFPINNPTAKMLVDLSRFGILKISGSDAAKFLQGQLSCDVNALQPGNNTLGAYCNIKGKVSSLFRIWRAADDFYMRLGTSLIGATQAELQKYAMFSKVTIQDVSDHMHGFGIADHKINLVNVDPNLFVITITVGHRYEIYGSNQALQHLWRECSTDAGHVDPSMWDILDIQDRLPELYPATINEFFAHDLNLAALNAVSFTKGCFRGQEIIARMQHRGNLKRHLQLFKVAAVDCAMQPGHVITAGGPEQETPAGVVVRVAQVSGDEILGLAVLTDAFLQSRLALPASKNAAIKLL